jgi:hypothetical protein
MLLYAGCLMLLRPGMEILPIMARVVEEIVITNDGVS